MEENFPNIKIIEVNLPLDEERKRYDHILEKFFSEHPEVHHCITLNSKAHIVGKFLLKTHRHNVRLWAMTWYIRMLTAYEKGVYRSSSHSMPTNKATSVLTPSSVLSC